MVSILLICMTIYCLCMALVLVIVGAFTGPVILAAAGAHLATGIWAEILRRFLQGRVAWAYWATCCTSMLWSLVGLIALWQMISARAELGAVFWPLLLVSVSVFILVVLLKGDVRNWFAQQSQNGGQS